MMAAPSPAQALIPDASPTSFDDATAPPPPPRPCRATMGAIGTSLGSGAVPKRASTAGSVKENQKSELRSWCSRWWRRTARNQRDLGAYLRAWGGGGGGEIVSVGGR
jgi:hypothetical protein